LDKILQTGVDYGDMVKIEDVEFQYGGRLGEFHGIVIPQPPATLQGAVT